jgi:hypothetical protein
MLKVRCATNAIDITALAIRLPVMEQEKPAILVPHVLTR